MTNPTHTTTETHEPSEKDAMADAIAAVALIALFVATCIFWISGQ
ncbi:hypothetical protein [Marinimicrobium sp. ARAG 43.8]